MFVHQTGIPSLTQQHLPMEQHIFQTIFLNDKHTDTWSKDEIRKDKISASPFLRLYCADRRSPRRLVASALPFLDALRFRCTIRLGLEPKLEAHDICRSMDIGQCT